jgi:hypothetical protein
MLRKLSDVAIAKCGPELVGCHRQICATAKPRLHLWAKATWLQLVHDALQIPQVRNVAWRVFEFGPINQINQKSALRAHLSLWHNDFSNFWRRGFRACRVAAVSHLSLWHRRF